MRECRLDGDQGKACADLGVLGDLDAAAVALNRAVWIRLVWVSGHRHLALTSDAGRCSGPLAAAASSSPLRGRHHLGAWRHSLMHGLNAPMSQAGPCGRVMPRWPVGGSRCGRVHRGRCRACRPSTRPGAGPLLLPAGTSTGIAAGQAGGLWAVRWQVVSALDETTDTQPRGVRAEATDVPGTKSATTDTAAAARTRSNASRTILIYLRAANPVYVHGRDGKTVQLYAGNAAAGPSSEAAASPTATGANHRPQHHQRQ